MNERKLTLLTMCGMTVQVERIKEGRCPTCGHVIDPSSFRDELSRKEFGISGMCQKCQDETFHG